MLFALTVPCPAQTPPTLHNRAGLQMTVETADADPALRITVPGGPPAERSFKLLLPEHVTVRQHGQLDANHLYVFQPGAQGHRPHWVAQGNTLRYQAQFAQAVEFAATATLAPDGILLRYDFVNRSPVDYDMATAITDPRFHTLFYDPRLQRTYVHHSDGFELLAADTPERLTLPLTAWFPVRYHASYTAPVPAQRLQHSDDGVTRRYNARPVDVPMIATLSSDGQWVAASFSRNPGNVWTNPELTCQHVDPEVALPAHSRAHFEVKLLLFRGSLDDALGKVRAQRDTLK